MSIRQQTLDTISALQTDTDRRSPSHLLVGNDKKVDQTGTELEPNMVKVPAHCESLSLRGSSSDTENRMGPQRKRVDNLGPVLPSHVFG